jgi:hypothetical protein
MLNTKPHTVTRVVDGEAVTLVFYPDTGCLRFVDARGLCHELRPPHSWLAMSAVSRGVCRGAQAMTDGLSLLLNDFCAKRPRWLSGPQHVSAYESAGEPGYVRACSPTREPIREAAREPAGQFADLHIRATA